MSEQRKKAVSEGRAMIRVRYTDSREPTAIADGGKPHAPGCPYAGKTIDPWERFSQALE